MAARVEQLQQRWGVYDANSGSGSSPAAVSISGGNAHAGNGGPAEGRASTKLNLKPTASLEPPAGHHGPAVIGAIDPKLPPEVILSGKEIYTLHIDMPNFRRAARTHQLPAQLENPPFNKPKGTLSGLSLVSKI